MDERAVFGDFQTPPRLADALVAFVARRAGVPDVVVEPTVGRGSILAAALAKHPSARAIGVEIAPSNLAAARDVLAPHANRVRLHLGDAFAFDFASACSASERVLLVGNPPWVTSADMPRLGGSNLPAKSGRAGLRGLDAKTGKANFDVAEWLLADLAMRMRDRDATFAFLVKTQVARRLVVWAERASAPVFDASIASIDAARWFGASVDACAFVFTTRTERPSRDVAIFDSLDAVEPRRTIGMRHGMLVADVDAYEPIAELVAEPSRFEFRSGVKHDAADVFELGVDDGRLVSRGGDAVDLEADVVFPFVKGGDLGKEAAPRRAILLTQRRLTDDPADLAVHAPRAHAYLVRNGARLDARRSSIYRSRPRFSIFGIGDYAFAEHKVAVFGLAKSPRFHLVGPRDGKPTMLDDTAYFLPCPSREVAEAVIRGLSTPTAHRILSVLVFQDAKRPISKEILARIDPLRIAERAAAVGELAASDLESLRGFASSTAMRKR